MNPAGHSKGLGFFLDMIPELKKSEEQVEERPHEEQGFGPRA